MPRDAIPLSDKRIPTIGIFCALCQRRETFDVESLKLQRGADVKMPDLLATLVADCPRSSSARLASITHAKRFMRDGEKGRDSSGRPLPRPSPAEGREPGRSEAITSQVLMGSRGPPSGRLERLQRCRSQP
jgi:hypothetical protein